MGTRKANQIYTGALSLALIASVTLAQRPPVRGGQGAITPTPGTSSTNQPGLPAGHPAMPTDGALPSGHPAVSGGAPAAGMAGHSSEMTGAKSGAIKVNVTQGTPDGGKLGLDPVTVQLFAKGVSIKTFKSALDENGVIELHDLPLDVPFQPIITVTHNGADEQYVGPPMHKLQPMVEMDMRVYDTTGVKPAWSIGLRDVDVDVVDAGGTPGLHFTELLGGSCPGDRAWTGEVVGGQLRTMTLRLPEEAMQVELGPGFAEAGAQAVDHTIIRGKTMLPGTTQYVFGYTIVAKDGKVTASFTAPTDITLFALYLPKDIKVETLTGLELAQASGTNATQNRQLLKAKSVKAGQTLSAVLTGIKMPVAATKPEVLPQTSDLHLPVSATKPGN